MKMTMQTPGRKVTIELPAWLERRIIALFWSKARRENKKANNDQPTGGDK